jgi:phospholipid-binding lipoprotein MlaA
LRPRHLFALLALGLAVAAQARAQTPDDPHEELNRRFYASTMETEKRYFVPISHLYQSLTPGVLGLAIHNFVTNLSEPVVVANDLLQLRLRRGADDLARLVTNTTFGIGGIIDLAKRQGLPHRDNDFGVTLGRLGVKPGPYLFLPLVGPSDVRDAIGMGVDALMGPLNWVRFPGRLTLQVTTSVVGALDLRLRAQGELEAATAGATDPYATIRSDYLQSREAMIRGEEAAPVLTPLDEPPAPATAPAGESSPPDGGSSPSAAAPPSSPAFASADAVATAAAGGAAPTSEAATGDPDLAMVTAQPCDRDPADSATRLAGL